MAKGFHNTDSTCSETEALAISVKDLAACSNCVQKDGPSGKNMISEAISTGNVTRQLTKRERMRNRKSKRIRVVW